MKLNKDSLYKYALLLQAFAGGLALAVYAYIGTFTRLLADDYYHLSLLQSEKNLLQISVDKYLNVSNRYATMPIFAFEQWLGIKWVAGLMIFLWILGLSWLLIEAQKRIATKLPRWVLSSIALLLIFLSILQAPNRFQSIYWISSSVTYFFPLVFFSFLLAGIFAFLGQPRSKASLFGMGLFNILAIFIIGGLSETVGAMHIAILILILLAFWIRGAKEKRIPASTLLGAALLGALISLAVMALSPANAIRSSDGNVALSILFQRLFIFPYGFITDTLKTLPLPSIFTMLVGFLITSGFSPPLRGELEGGGEKNQILRWALLLAPIITFALIAASFAPSAYALSYPDARVRFPARFIMTSGLFIEGALLGLWLGREKFRVLATLLLAASAIYPLRGAWQAYQTIPKFQTYADAWDTRDAYIQSKRDSGIMDIAVPPMDGMAGIKEFDVDPNHWVNRGAADYYGVDAISVHSSDLEYDE
ncbi:MAG: hypothetical protein GY755_16565 [Chloroflexi bacterium]|nr:hypothetical protein [Chloroflexota bacterium]